MSSSAAMYVRALARIPSRGGGSKSNCLIRHPSHRPTRRKAWPCQTGEQMLLHLRRSSDGLQASKRLDAQRN